MRNEIFKKMKKQNNVFGNLILGDYEQEIEDSIPNDYKPIYLSKKEKENFAKVAEKHELYQTSKRINIRIKNEDLIKVKAKAKESNIPYQTLLISVIHKYAKGDVKVSL